MLTVVRAAGAESRKLLAARLAALGLVIFQRRCLRRGRADAAADDETGARADSVRSGGRTGPWAKNITGQALDWHPHSWRQNELSRHEIIIAGFFPLNDFYHNYRRKTITANYRNLPQSTAIYRNLPQTTATTAIYRKLPQSTASIASTASTAPTTSTTSTGGGPEKGANFGVFTPLIGHFNPMLLPTRNTFETGKRLLGRSDLIPTVVDHNISAPHVSSYFQRSNEDILECQEQKPSNSTSLDYPRIHR